mmetsp:Transcript_43419/g.139393  ORF Transcript_43419/g.139393 Transcript_43419/m.139393 type:complete len:214 (+) Transcript_43419:548-1189(+)
MRCTWSAAFTTSRRRFGRRRTQRASRSRPSAAHTRSTSCATSQTRLRSRPRCTNASTAWWTSLSRCCAHRRSSPPPARCPSSQATLAVRAPRAPSKRPAFWSRRGAGWPQPRAARTSRPAPRLPRPCRGRPGSFRLSGACLATGPRGWCPPPTCSPTPRCPTTSTPPTSSPSSTRPPPPAQRRRLGTRQQRRQQLSARALAPLGRPRASRASW